MTNKNIEPLQSQAEVVGPPPPPAGQAPGPPDHTRSRGGNTVFKSGPLFISSKGIGWTSWKKRWFILTRTSLVFFRSDPSAIPQKGNEVNLTLGGIDLNNSGSVVVKADKKLLTVLFPDGRDGRAFTLKAETLEDLYEWRTALENALSQAPSASHVMGQNGIFRNDQVDAANGSSEKTSDKVSVRATILGTPVLLALEDVDGAPSFLEKALRFVEEHGVKVEGILRQAADVDDVERRIREYEQGKTEFSSEDPHVIADCVKYVIRELPSSPVPASCCKALLEACRTERSGRLNAIRTAICETFPEPNRRLLQRILMMMQTVASHKAENRMSSSAVAACMAPLLLRPLLAGDCEIENDFDVGGDGSVQLLQAAAAANHAQAIVITLLEEYDNIFGEGSTLTTDLYSDTEESGSESEDDDYYEDDENDDGTQESEAYTEDDHENASSGTDSESGESGDDDLNDHKDSDVKGNNDLKVKKTLSSSSRRTSLPRHNDVKPSENIPTENTSSETQLSTECSAETNTEHKLTSPPNSSIQKSSTISNGPGHHARQWGRTSAKRNLSMESIDYPIEEEEVEILRLEASKTDLQNRVAEEVKGNAILQASLERRKKALHERRLALEKDVARLQDQLERERNKRRALEAGLNMSQDTTSYPLAIDEETKAELQEIAKTEVDITKLEQKINDLGGKLDQSGETNLSSIHDSCGEPQQTSDHAKLEEKQKDNAATSCDFERSKSKDAYLGAPRSDNEKQKESTPLQSKHLQSQQPNPTQNNNSISGGMPVNSSAMDTSLVRPATTNTKKSGTRGEGTNSTSSALTKLTTRLHFLKERRSQIANELQNMDKGKRGSAQAAPDKVRGLDGTQSSRGPNKEVVGVEGESHQSSEKTNKSDSKSHQDLDGSKRSDGQHPQSVDRGKSEDQQPPSLDRGKSEGHVSYNADKVRGSGSHPRSTPRTFSR